MVVNRLLKKEKSGIWNSKFGMRIRGRGVGPDSLRNAARRPLIAGARAANGKIGMEKPENEKRSSRISWGYLPRSFYARTHGWPPPRHLAIYHANYTKGQDGVGQKLAQLREVDWMVRSGWPARILSIARRIPGRIFPLGSKDG